MAWTRSAIVSPCAFACSVPFALGAGASALGAGAFFFPSSFAFVIFISLH
jgi:hypothetical protein